MNEPLSTGDKAPDFCLLDQDEKKICLHTYLGRKVILYFYPRDNTPGCSLEAMMFTKYKTDFERYNTQILGVSKDSCASHRKFIEKKDLSITLLSDVERDVHRKYGVLATKKFMGKEILGTVRTTILIDEAGSIVKIWRNVKVKGHVEEVVHTVKEMHVKK